MTGSHDKTVRIWDVNKEKSLHTLTGHNEGVWCVNYNPAGTNIVTASPEGICKIWDMKGKKHSADLTAHTKRVIKVFNC